MAFKVSPANPLESAIPILRIAGQFANFASNPNQRNDDDGEKQRERSG
jgi:hypothetical protein